MAPTQIAFEQKLNMIFNKHSFLLQKLEFTKLLFTHNSGGDCHPKFTQSCCSPTVWGETGVLSDGGSCESSKESKDPIVDVRVAKDAVVGVGALGVAVPCAAPVPARVEHLVGKVLGASSKRSSPSSGVDRLVACEEPRVWRVLVLAPALLGTVPGQTGSSLGSGGGEDEEGGEECERDLHFLLSRQTRLESLRLVSDWSGQTGSSP